MKKLIVMITVIVLSVPIVFGNGEASAAEKFSSKAPESLMKSLQIDSFKLHVLNSLKDEYPKAHFVDITPVEYLIEFRISRAMVLLDESDISIEEVGRRCGFESASYFTKIFKRRTGVTPSIYCKRRASL